jgi:hypothetical protein
VFQNPGSYLGTQSLQSGNWIKGGLRNRNVGAFDQTFSAYGNGHLHPSAFILPNRSGSISSYTEVYVSIGGTANLVPAKPMEATGNLTITVTNAQLDKIASMAATVGLSITATNAALAAAAAMGATGTLTLSVTSAQLGGIFPILASGSMSITGTGTSFLTALAFMEAEAGGATPLSPEGLSAELLDNQDIETGYSLREALRIVLSSVAGKVSGAETTTITFRNIVDDKNRIVATVDSNGNRTALTYDVSDS